MYQREQDNKYTSKRKKTDKNGELNREPQKSNAFEVDSFFYYVCFILTKTKK